MAVKLSEAYLPQLLPWLEQHLPYTLKVHGELKSHLRGQFPDLEFFVDRWPHPQAVVARVDPEGTQLVFRRYLDNVIQGLYGVSDEALSRLLKNPGVVDWNTRTVFGGIPDRLVPLLKTVAVDMGKPLRFSLTFLMKAGPQDVKPIPVPQGMKFQPISSAEIQKINATWKFTGGESEQFVQGMVQHYPSLYMVTESGEHVGHMVGSAYGTMGMLYVNPDFRRRGYAKVIISQLSQKYFEHGEDAYVMVEESNPPSVTLHESLGFRVVPDMRLCWMHCDPADKQQKCTTCCV